MTTFDPKEFALDIFERLKKLDPEKVIYVVLGVLIVSYIIFSICLKLWGSYTVCKIRDIHTARGGTKISYEFYYRGKKRFGNVGWTLPKEKEGHFYFVKFWKRIPRANFILVDYPADSCAEQFQNIALDQLPECK